jgi:hypothetical protein
MKNFLIFLGGFVVGILATILVAYLITLANKPNDGELIGLTLFPEKGECITTNSTKKSCEIEIFQVLAPNAALGNLKYYTDIKYFDSETYRNYDISNEIVVLLINYENKTYYDDQKIEISNKCARQIGTYNYKNKIDFEKTVPAIVIE